MERGPSYNRPHRIERPISPEDLRMLRIEGFLRELLNENPDLRRYMNDATIRDASIAYRTIQEVLDNNPQLLKQLASAYEQKPDHVALLVIPHLRLVFSQSRNGIVAMAPVLGCTLNAIKDISTEEHSYEVVYSNNSLDTLEEFVWNLAERHPSVILTYNNSGMNPGDYIALAATGLLDNETFRKSIKTPQGRSIDHPSRSKF